MLTGREVIVAEILAARRQLVVLELGQHLLQLHEEPLARRIAVAGFYKKAQLTLVTSRIGYNIGHQATYLLPTAVGILKFCAIDMCAKRGKSIGTRGSCMSFEACVSRNLIHSVPLPRFGIAGAVCFEMSYLIDILLFR